MTDIARPADIVSDIINNRIGEGTLRPYQSVVGAVITALEERDGDIADALRLIGEGQGLRSAAVEAALVEVGLVVPEPEEEPEPEPQMGEEAPAWAQTLLQRVDAVTARVDRLARYAQDQFGVEV